MKTTEKIKSNHTIMVMEVGYNIWITLLKSTDPTLREYRFTFSDGVVRYFVIEEILNSPMAYIAPQLLNLTDYIDENDITLYNGKFLVKNK